MRRSSLVVALALLATTSSVGLLAHPSWAAPPAKPPASKPTEDKPIDVGPIVTKLRSGSESSIREALDDARTAGPRAKGAAAPIAELLERGLSRPLTESAIVTLGDIESEAGTRALSQYAVHRDVKLRRAAIQALVRTKGKDAGAALRRALGDSDAVIRGAAASGLGALRAKDAVPDLFVALDHRVVEAAASIGLLCDAGQCADLASKLGKLPLDVVTTGIDPILFRPASEISDDAKVKIIVLLRDLGTAESNKYLRDVQARASKEANVSPRVRQSMDQAVTATSGGAR